ncbi:MAG TPA: hypothetical protein ENK57_03515 [Polyangiaceae bacterium]|nr:hypothetical protein [Polyangiaceae bacterium]
MPTDHQSLLLTHTTFVALTPLIPLPFVDDMVQGRLERRMVRLLAEAHGLRIWEEEIKILAHGPRKSVVAGIAKGVVLAPFKKILRKVFIVLTGKKMVDLATQTYHVGWLLDLAFARGWCSPAGPHHAREIRAAIERVLAQVPLATSPVTRALEAGYDSSREALGDLFEMVQAQMGVLRREPRDDQVDGIVDDVERHGVMGKIVEQLRHALVDVPEEHFVDLERRLAGELGELEDGVAADLSEAPPP